MKLKQRMELVQKDYYDDLLRGIQDVINDLEDLYEIQQINYFSMSETEYGQCSAFILFKPKPRDLK